MELSPQPITFMTMQPNRIEIARTIKMMPWTARERCVDVEIFEARCFLQIPQQNMLSKDFWPEIKTQ